MKRSVRGFVRKAFQKRHSRPHQSARSEVPCEPHGLAPAAQRERLEQTSPGPSESQEPRLVVSGQPKKLPSGMLPERHESVTTAVAHQPFVPLSEVLEQASQQFPRARDFREDLVYLPEDYASVIRSHLAVERRCLLVGRSAAGKTVLALALGRQLQSEGYKVLYTDTVQGYPDDGEVWYQSILENDRSARLYLLDNCHLAPKQADEFCACWEDRPPAHAAAILITRPLNKESVMDSSNRTDYFEMWADVTISVRSERIYRGVLLKYANAYRRMCGNKYADLEQDNEIDLQAQHSHNLVVSKIRLEAWREAGGLLSQVDQNAVFEILARGYIDGFPPALFMLCALWQFEVAAHESFVQRCLTAEELALLEGDNLLVRLKTPSYGILYRPLFHPEEARYLFEASVRREHAGSDISIYNQTLRSILTSYLASCPPNYRSVYDGLYHAGQRQLEASLLQDPALQALTVGELAASPLVDAAKYLFCLSTVDGQLAQALLWEFISKVGHASIHDMLQRCSLHDLQSTLYFFQRLNLDLARGILERQDMSALARRTAYESLTTLEWTLRSFATLSHAETEKFLNALPLPALAAKATSTEFRRVAWLLQRMSALPYAAEKTATLVDNLDLQMLAREATHQPVSSGVLLTKAIGDVSASRARHLVSTIEALSSSEELRATPAQIHLLCLLRRLLQPASTVDRLINEVDAKGLAEALDRAEPAVALSTLRNVGTLSRWLASYLVDRMSPAQLAVLCRSQAATIEDLWTVHRNAPNKEYRIELYHYLSTQDLLLILYRSRIGAIGRYFLSCYSSQVDLYDRFRAEFLADKLSQASLYEIGIFLRRIRRIAKEGPSLASDALDLLRAENVFGSVIKRSNRKEMKAFRRITATIDPTWYPPRVVGKRYTVHSIVATVEERIKERGSKAKEPLPNEILHPLSNTELVSELSWSGLGEVASLLRTVAMYCEEETRSEYLEMANQCISSDRLMGASDQVLGELLWELVVIADHPSPHVVCQPVLDRIANRWAAEPLAAARLLGILCSVNPEIGASVARGDIRSSLSVQHGAAWLTSVVEKADPKNCLPTALNVSLWLRGLWACDEKLVQEILLLSGTAWGVGELLADAGSAVIAPQTDALFDECRNFLAHVLFMETIGWADEARAIVQGTWAAEQQVTLKHDGGDE